MAQRVDDVAKYRFATLERFVIRQHGDCVEDAPVGPAIVAGQHTKSAFAHFTKSPCRGLIIKEGTSAFEPDITSAFVSVCWSRFIYVLHTACLQIRQRILK